jgi:hypothetical protein
MRRPSAAVDNSTSTPAAITYPDRARVQTIGASSKFARRYRSGTPQIQFGGLNVAHCPKFRSQQQSVASRLIAGSKVDGNAVYELAGEKLGIIKEIYFEKPSGKVEFAALTFGGALGAGEKFHPLPWEALDYDTDKDGFVVAIDDEGPERFANV